MFGLFLGTHIQRRCLKNLLQVLPENYWRGRRPLVPLWMKHISIVVGEPIQFDVPGLKLPMTGPGLLQVLMIPMANYFSP
jgi:hypothetical protein